MVKIKQGTVVYFKESSHPEKSPPHYFVVLNRQPQKDSTLVLVCATSQKDTVQRYSQGMPPMTVVTVTPSEYSEFHKETFFNCNCILKKKFDQLMAKYRRGHLKFKYDMPNEILKKLIDSVKSSSEVPKNYKKLL